MGTLRRSGLGASRTAIVVCCCVGMVWKRYCRLVCGMMDVVVCSSLVAVECEPGI
jgi:hypothetical protein